MGFGPHFYGWIKYFKHGGLLLAHHALKLGVYGQTDSFGENVFPYVVTNEFLAAFLQKLGGFVVDVGVAPLTVKRDKSIGDTF